MDLSEDYDWKGSSALEQALERVIGDPEDLPEDAVKDLIVSLTEKYGQPRVGGGRAAWDRGDGWMIKIPLSYWGLHQIRRELKHWEDGCPNIPFTEIKEIDLHPEVKVILVEKVTPLKGDENNWLEYSDEADQYPDWLWLIDSEQAGYNSKGDLVAYDI